MYIFSELKRKALTSTSFLPYGLQKTDGPQLVFLLVNYLKIKNIIFDLIHGSFAASNYGGIIAMFLMPAIATGADKIEITVR